MRKMFRFRYVLREDAGESEIPSSLKDKKGLALPTAEEGHFRGRRERKGPGVEKELSVILSRPVQLEHKEGCWVGGGYGERGGEQRVIREKEVAGGHAVQGLVFGFSFRWISKPLAFGRSLPWPL